MGISFSTRISCSAIPDRRCSRADSDVSIECSSCCCSNKRPKRATSPQAPEIEAVLGSQEPSGPEFSNRRGERLVIRIPPLEPVRQHEVGGQALGLSAFTVPLLHRPAQLHKRKCRRYTKAQGARHREFRSYKT